MTEIGAAFTTTINLSGSSFTEIFAPTGEQIKITMVYAKATGTSAGNPANNKLNVSPASGTESKPIHGTVTGASGVPPIGSNSDFDSNSKDISSLQPTLITDSDGLFIGNDSSNGADVLVRGVRVA